MNLNIDARMLFFSGIGRFLRNILLHMDLDDRSVRFFTHGEREIEFLRAHFPKARVNIDASAIYSVREQFSPRARTPKRATLWCPHYNVPVFSRSRLVVTVHDALHLAMPELFGGWKQQIYARWMFRAVCWRAKRIVCVSQFTALELQRLLKVKLKNISVIPCGTEEWWFEPLLEAPKPRAKPFVLFVGNVKPHKNLSRLISAFTRIADRRPHELLIVGQTAGFIVGDEASLEIPAALQERLFFLGTIPDPELKALYHQCALLAFPSLYEGFGLPPLEALACGAQVLCSDAASLPETCGNAVTYCNPLSVEDIASKLNTLLAASPAELLAKAETGRAHAKKFSWQRSAEAMQQLLSAV